MKQLIYLLISFLFFDINKGFILKKSIPQSIIRRTIKYNEQNDDCIPLPPTAKAIQRLQENGYSYIWCLKALVREKNNETKALIYLNTTELTKEYVK